MDVDRPVVRALEMVWSEDEAVDVGHEQVVVRPLDLAENVGFRRQVAYLPIDEGHLREVPLADLSEAVEWSCQDVMISTS